MILATQIFARAIGAPQVELGLRVGDMSVMGPINPECLDMCLDVYSRCRMTPEGCKMMFVRCMRSCDPDPVVPFEQTVTATDAECIKNCDEHFETCKLAPWACRWEWLQCVETCEKPSEPIVAAEVHIEIDIDEVDTCFEICEKQYITCKLPPIICRQQFVDCIRNCADEDLVEVTSDHRRGGLSRTPCCPCS